ncbi:MAG: hypothetical protein QM765_13575 [Myxococcales bacterium]
MKLRFLSHLAAASLMVVGLAGCPGPATNDPDTGGATKDTGVEKKDSGTANPCGNGTIDGNEQCDGDALNSKTCVTEGFGGGNLGCKSNCTFNFSNCTPGANCGNSAIDSNEQCDKANLNNKTCQTEGFASGSLTCNDNCSLNTSACVGAVVLEDDDTTCADGVDNDGNGKKDCEDTNCCDNGPKQGISVCDQTCGQLVRADAGPVAKPDGSVVVTGDAGGTKETTDDLCKDGIDNDGDGYTDCADHDCCKFGVPADGITVCTAPTCGGGVRDAGGLVKFDAGDTKENTDDLCKDGIDNDGDGHSDCDDYDCCKYGVPAQGINVCTAGTCGGGTRDAGTVAPKDAGSTGPNETTDDLCKDGIDNDGDTFTDCDDFDCCKYGVPAQGINVCTAGTCGGGTRDAGTVAPGRDASLPENTDELCKDGIDNNGNTYIDCADYSCCRPGTDGGVAPGVTVCAPITCQGPGKMPEDTQATCSDGKDNDGNKKFDCNDPGCCRPGTDGGMLPGLTCEFGSCAGPGREVTSAATANDECSDGLDNNGNTFTDCADFDCCRNGVPAPGVTTACKNDGTGKCVAGP